MITKLLFGLLVIFAKSQTPAAFTGPCIPALPQTNNDRLNTLVHAVYQQDCASTYENDPNDAANTFRRIHAQTAPEELVAMEIVWAQSETYQKSRSIREALHILWNEG